MIKENANYYKSLNDDISDSYNTITMKKMDYGMTLSIVKIFLWLTTTPRSLKAGQLPKESATCIVVSFKLFHGLKQGLY